MGGRLHASVLSRAICASHQPGQEIMKLISRKRAAEKGNFSLRTFDRVARDPKNGIKLVQSSKRRINVVEETYDAYLARQVRVAEYPDQQAVLKTPTPFGDGE